MTLHTPTEVSNTREKLAWLEDRHEALRHEAGGDEELRNATMQSLRRYINQFKEEIARYQAQQPVER